jgi:hypothetical protein
MTREQKLVARLETHEKAVEETKAKLLEAQRGFLTALGWVRDSASTDPERWIDSADGNAVSTDLDYALMLARSRITR